MTDYTKIGRMVKRYRHWNELTQAQLAELIGVSTSFVGHIERGSHWIWIWIKNNPGAAMPPGFLVSVIGNYWKLGRLL